MQIFLQNKLYKLVKLLHILRKWIIQQQWVVDLSTLQSKNVLYIYTAKYFTKKISQNKKIQWIKNIVS